MVFSLFKNYFSNELSIFQKKSNFHKFFNTLIYNTDNLWKNLIAQIEIGDFRFRYSKGKNLILVRGQTTIEYLILAILIFAICAAIMSLLFRWLIQPGGLTQATSRAVEQFFIEKLY
ncbi:MAG: hypothetical protein AB1410_04820 [Acidobacteriota bacterium]